MAREGRSEAHRNDKPGRKEEKPLGRGKPKRHPKVKGSTPRTLSHCISINVGDEGHDEHALLD